MQSGNSVSDWPSEADKKRLKNYDYFDKLYNGDHFDAFLIRGEKEFSEAYNRLRYVAVNFPGLMSRVMADMLFGEKVTIDLQNAENQEFIDNVVNENQLITQLHESALANSRRGDSLFKVRIGQRNPSIVSQPATIIIEEIDPRLYFPTIGVGDTRYTPSEEVIAWTFKEVGVTYLHKEIHKPGYIAHEIYKYDPEKQQIISREPAKNFGYADLEETKVDRSLVFHIPNVRDGNGYFGTSDYRDLSQLFFALNNRVTKIDNILDKHGDPILYVPEGLLDEKGQVRKEALGMVEGGAEGGQKPEYIVWDAKLEAAFDEIDKMVEFLFMVSEVSPASMGMDKEGQIESGRALKLKLISTLRKRNRKIRYYDQAVKDMLETVQELAIAHGIAVGGKKVSKAERPTIDWGDGVVNDETEMVDNATKRVDAGLSSRADEIARLDGMTPDEAKKKVKEIDDESAADVTALTGGNRTGQPNTPQKQPGQAGA